MAGWKDEKPQYQLDFTTNKQNLATEIGNSTEARLSGLPRCGPTEIPETLDAFRINCLPFGVSAKSVAQSAASGIGNDQGFLKDPVISSDNLSDASEGAVEDKPVERLDGLRSMYENTGLLLWLLPLATAAFAALGVFVAKDRLKALRRLGRSFISSGAGLAVFALLIGFGFENAVRAVSKEAVTRDIISPLFISLAQQVRTVYWIFAGVAVVIAIVLFVVQRKLLKPGKLA